MNLEQNKTGTMNGSHIFASSSDVLTSVEAAKELGLERIDARQVDLYGLTVVREIKYGRGTMRFITRSSVEALKHRMALEQTRKAEKEARIAQRRADRAERKLGKKDAAPAPSYSEVLERLAALDAKVERLIKLME